MSVGSNTCDSSAVHVSSKPWFLTFNADTNDVFVWRNDVWLRLKDGESTGSVRSVAILSDKDKTVTVSANYIVETIFFVTGYVCTIVYTR